MASDVASTASEAVLPTPNNKRFTVADTSTTLMNVLKLRRQSDVTDVVSKSASECSGETGRGSQGFKLPPRRQSSMASISEDGKGKVGMLVRRNTFKGLAQSITGMLRLRRLTMPKLEPNRPKVKVENTYRMTPDAGQRVAVGKIGEVVQQLLEDELSGMEYNSNVAGETACNLSSKIKNRVKELNFPRFRIICQVVITQVKEQGLEAASRCLWDDRADTYTTVTYTNDSVAAIAMIYGVYLE